MKIEDQDDNLKKVVIPPNMFDDKIQKTVESDEKSDKSEDKERPEDFDYEQFS